jgi:hypothetical protein
MTRTSNIIPLRPYDPVPWETFAQVEPPRPNPEPAMFWKAFIFLCALAVVVGTLFAANN